MQLQLVVSSCTLSKLLYPYIEILSYFFPQEKTYYSHTLFIPVHVPGRRAYYHGHVKMQGISSEKRHPQEGLEKEDIFLALSTHSWSVDAKERWTTNGWTDGRGGGRKISDPNCSPTNTCTTTNNNALDICDCLTTFNSSAYHATVQRPDNVVKQ